MATMSQRTLVSSLDTDDERAHRTEVCWPVFRTGA